MAMSVPSPLPAIESSLIQLWSPDSGRPDVLSLSLSPGSPLPITPRRICCNGCAKEGTLVEIIFHAHNATIPELLRDRAERAVTKFGRRLQRAVDAVVRFEDDGPTRRVEIVLHAPQHRNLVAEGRSRSYASALKDALARLQAQIPKKNPMRTRVRLTTLATRSA